MVKRPHLINFGSVGTSEIGFLSVAQEYDKIPFQIKRVYWTYYTPQKVIRGGHANIAKELVLIAVAGSINVQIETLNGNISDFKLDDPTIGLYIPKLCWHLMEYSHNAVQLVIASNDYSEADYIRNYNEFKIYNNL